MQLSEFSPPARREYVFTGQYLVIYKLQVLAMQLNSVPSLIAFMSLSIFPALKNAFWLCCASLLTRKYTKRRCTSDRASSQIQLMLFGEW